MKKIYIRPTIDFEFLEEDDMLMVSAEYVLGEDKKLGGYETNQESDDIGEVDDYNWSDFKLQ